MTARSWQDLRPRVLSALALAAIAALAVAAGPAGFALLVAVVGGVMTWELMRMHGPRLARVPVPLAAAATTLALLGWTGLATGGGASRVLGPLGFGLLVGLLALDVRRDRRVFAAYLAAIVLSCAVLIATFARAPFFALFVLLIVIATDVGGYFAGRLIGGPLVWHRLSPKKTWAGILGGWALAAGLALALNLVVRLPDWIALWAVGMSMAAQAGDFAESALKRRAGVKDSSNLIPGHGGFLDRFDGVVGAALALALMEALA